MPENNIELAGNTNIKTSQVDKSVDTPADFTSPEVLYNKLIETNPEFLKAYYNKAAMLMGMGDFMEASRTFFQLIKRNPDYYKAYLGIAMSFDKMAKYKDAIRYYKKFLELKQFSEDAIFARNRINELRAEYFSKDNSLTLIE